MYEAKWSFICSCVFLHLMNVRFIFYCLLTVLGLHHTNIPHYKTVYCKAEGINRSFPVGSSEQMISFWFHHIAFHLIHYFVTIKTDKDSSDCSFLLALGKIWNESFSPDVECFLFLNLILQPFLIKRLSYARAVKLIKTNKAQKLLIVDWQTPLPNVTVTQSHVSPPT